MTDMASDKRARLFPPESMSLGLKVETNGLASPQLGAQLISELIGLSGKGVSCCLVAGFVVFFVDHLWQAGGSKLNLMIPA